VRSDDRPEADDGNGSCGADKLNIDRNLSLRKDVVTDLALGREDRSTAGEWKLKPLAEVAEGRNLAVYAAGISSQTD